MTQRLTPAERARIDGRSRDPVRFERLEQAAEAERVTDRRLWAAVMLTLDQREVCCSILTGQPVLARQLDAGALRRALRGRPLPPPEAYLVVTADELDAISEGGTFTPKARQR